MVSRGRPRARAHPNHFTVRMPAQMPSQLQMSTSSSQLRAARTTRERTQSLPSGISLRSCNAPWLCCGARGQLCRERGQRCSRTSAN